MITLGNLQSKGFINKGKGDQMVPECSSCQVYRDNLCQANISRLSDECLERKFELWLTSYKGGKVIEKTFKKFFNRTGVKIS